MKYFLAFITTIVLIIVLIILLFGGGEDKKPESAASQTLVSYATKNSEVRLTVDGPTNANSEHLQERIVVNKDKVVYQRLRGYEGSVELEKTFGNNDTAYGHFLKSLQLAGFMQGDKSPELIDERGQCALGNRYIFELENDNKLVHRFWSTSCDEAETYQGNTRQTLRLFKDQVPAYSETRSHFDDNVAY